MGRILFLIALRNLRTHRTSTLIVGTIIFFGTFLVVMGTSMLDSINDSMSRSVVSSLAGHLQVYSEAARDDLALFGGFFGGNDFGAIEDFHEVRTALEEHPNVKAVVPMGVQGSIVLQGNDIDLTLASLREAVEQGDGDAQRSLKQTLLNIASDLMVDLENRLPVSADRAQLEAGLADLREVQTEAFWQNMEEDPEGTLLFLDSHLAPLSADGRVFYLRNLGTDVHRFAQLFDRFELAEGQMIPPGQRGILLSEMVYEKQIKHRVARELDKLHRSVAKVGTTIAGDSVLEDIVRRLPRQYPRIKNQLSARDAEALEEVLREILPNTQGGLTELLQAFLTVNDHNFLTRYQQFYEHIAPRIRLYALPVGDTFTVRTVTKSGYMKSVRIKVWGTYRFKGLEESDLAGAQNLLDLITFRELYGVMSSTTQEELAGIREEVGVAEVGRAEAEDALFGDGGLFADEDDAGAQEEAFEVGQLEAVKDGSTKPYTQADIDQGLAINAAVILHEGDRLWQTKGDLETLIADKGLGLKVVDWQTAAGIVGQFIIVSRIVLYVAILIIFVVALVIINNSMVMATLERTPEIGTMRAIGAQRRFVMGMFLLETVVLGLLAGSAGALAGAACIEYLGWVGVPAPSEFLVFLFSGPRLYPSFGAANLIFSFAVVLLVSLASTLYPARVAAKIQPVVAMQPKE